MFVFSGGNGGTDTTADWTAESNSMNAHFGLSLSSGDFNGDGADDIVIGCPDKGFLNPGDGGAFVYFGSGTVGLNGGVIGSVSSFGWGTYGETNSARYGFSLATGDCDNDGYDELLIGAPHQGNSGKAYLFEGTGSGLNGSTSWRGASTQSGGEFSYAVAIVDVNGSGSNGDIVIGSPNYDNGSADGGVVFIWHGIPGIDGTTSNYSSILEKNQGSSRFGFALAGGDVNDDGYQDLLVGAPYYDNGSTDEGSAFLYHGSGSGVSSSNWMGESNQAKALFGWSVAVGNLTLTADDDHYADVAVGSPYYDYAATTNGGGTFVWYGSGSGLGSNGNPSNMDFSAFNVTNNECHSGWSIAIGDNIEYQRYAGLIIGSPDEDGGGQTDRGAVNVFTE